MQNNGEHRNLDRIIRYAELEKIFCQHQRTIRRKSEKRELPALVKSGHVVGMLQSAVEEHFQRLREGERN